MVRKKRTEQAEQKEAEAAAPTPSVDEIEGQAVVAPAPEEAKGQRDLTKAEAEIPAQPVDEIEGQPASAPVPEEPKKQWAKRPDPFPIHSINWQDGYKVSLIESDSNREIYIQFGSGARSDQPKAFEAIKKLFKEEYGMYWDPKVEGWAKGLKSGMTPLIREQNREIRGNIEEAFFRAVALEESARGPSLSEHARQRGGNSR